MKNVSMEKIVLIALVERMLQKNLFDKNDLVAMRKFSMSLLEKFAESPDSNIVNSTYKVSKEVSDFFEGYLRAFR